MNDSVSMEAMGSRPVKTPKLDEKAMVESKPTSTYARLKGWEPEKDEYIRQYLLFHCQYYETKGTNLVFVDHVDANYTFTSGLLCWLTFWAIDMNSSRKEPKIYQAKVRSRGLEFKIFIFRLKSREEKIASVDVEPPSPIYDDNNEPAVVFARAGPEDDSGVPFVFRRTGAGLDP